MGQDVRCWSTDDVTSGQALRYWSEAVAEDLIGCVITSEDSAVFKASLRSYALGLTDLHFVRSSPSDIRRTRDCISRSKNERYYLIHQRKARVTVEQHGRVAVVEPGDCVLVSGRAPYRIQHAETMAGMGIAIQRPSISFS